MKATNKQYKKAVKLYEDGGATAVYDYAKEIGIDEWSTCEPCEAETPDCKSKCCLVCGSSKEQNLTLKDRLKIATNKQLRECRSLLQYRQTGKGPFMFPIILKDRGEVKGNTKACITLENDCILFNAKGYSDCVTANDQGYPFLIERYNKEIYIRLWNDINTEDPTDNISLRGARNDNRTKAIK